MAVLSPKQLNFYYEVCARKKVQPKDVEKVSPFQLGQFIEETLALPNPAYENQLNTLREMLQELVSANVPGIRFPGQKFFDSLNAETASDWIKRTQELRNKFLHILPATEQQIERLADMYLFPEVEWESVNKETRETAEYFEAEGDDMTLRYHKETRTIHESTTISTKIWLDEEYNGKRLWRYMTPNEFKHELKKLTHQQASQLLDKYTGAFEAWRRSRLTLSQKQQIRKLENRMASIYTPKQVTAFELDMPFDLELGDTNVESDVDAPFQVKSKKLDNWNPTAYEGLQEQQLDMFSRDEADLYIRQLRMELQDRETRNVGGAQNLDYENYGIEDARTAKNDADARTKEFKELNNFLYGLSDVCGFMFECDGATVDSLRADALNVFFDNRRSVKNGDTVVNWTEGASMERKEELYNKIKDFVRYAVMSKSIKFIGLMGLADRSVTAGEIIDDLCEEPEFAKACMKLQRSQF